MIAGVLSQRAPCSPALYRDVVQHCRSALRQTGVSPSRSLCTCLSQPSNQEPVRRNFNQVGFIRVRLERVTATKAGTYGCLVFVRHESRRTWLHGAEPGLVVHVNGDTLYCLVQLLRNKPTTRPMPLELLSAVLQQKSENSSEDWGLVRVAIIDLQQETYIARAYFGNRRTGEVSWEQDIRPSDATYLAHRWKVPLFIDSSVWEETAMTHNELQLLERESGLELQHDDSYDKEISNDSVEAPVEPSSPIQRSALVQESFTSGILMSDPEPVKMFKRQMALAVAEENYAYAAKLRDSPIMQLYKELQRLRSRGDNAAALRVQDKFDAAAAQWEFRSDDYSV